MKRLTGIALATLALVGTASAAPGWQQATGSRLERRHLGYPARSLAGSMSRARVSRDVQGRDLRSSTRGNAQFPERPPVQQNLGGTAGGPEF